MSTYTDHDRNIALDMTAAGRTLEVILGGNSHAAEMSSLAGMSARRLRRRPPARSLQLL